MGDGTKEHPYTRQDVKRLVRSNVGKSVPLDFTKKIFEEGIILGGLDLEGAIFREAVFQVDFTGKKPVSVVFNGSNLSRADFSKVNLQYAQFGMADDVSTCLECANFQSTILLYANFQGADLSCAVFGKTDDNNYGPARLEKTDFRDSCLFKTNFKGCYFYETKFEDAYIRGADIYEAHLEYANWGNYFIGEEDKEKNYYAAEEAYRRLKVWYRNVGLNDQSAHFRYREVEAQRKGTRISSNPPHRIRLELSFLLFGHGEGWKRIFYWIVGFILFFGIVFFGINSVWENGAFWKSLYFSVVSFSALGYGSWIDGNWISIGNNWIKGLGAFESLVGISTMALLLVTFVRKWTR